MDKVEYRFKKSTCEKYEIRFGQYGWAIIMIDEEGGLFSAQSDYGNFAYSWPRHGRKSFKHFLVEISSDSYYFLKKVSSETYFDYERNLKRWKETIIEHRKKNDCTKEAARDAWDFLTGLDDYSSSAHAIQLKIFETDKLNGISDEPWYIFETDLDYPPDAKAFFDVVMPMFADILKQEIKGIN